MRSSTEKTERHPADSRAAAASAPLQRKGRPDLEEGLAQPMMQRAVAPEEEPKQPMMQRAAAPVQREEAAAAPNRTGMPDSLKSGVESLSGHDLSDVRVHYNSPAPAQMQALAYAQGNDIHVGPGQEKHLPHEAWHVVQQREGRVQATTQLMKGTPINDDPSLEAEATHMGNKAASLG